MTEAVELADILAELHAATPTGRRAAAAEGEGIMRSTNERARLAAYHEAGHAVIGIRLGLRPRIVSIKPDVKMGTLGHVLDRKLRSDFDTDGYGQDSYWIVRRKFEPRILSSLAGVYAERRFSGRRHNWSGARNDLSYAADIALSLEGPTIVNRYLSWLNERARLLVEINWPWITRLAEALVERETIRGPDINATAFGLSLSPTGEIEFRP